MLLDDDRAGRRRRRRRGAVDRHVVRRLVRLRRMVFRRLRLVMLRGRGGMPASMGRRGHRRSANRDTREHRHHHLLDRLVHITPATFFFVVMRISRLRDDRGGRPKFLTMVFHGAGPESGVRF